MAFKLPDITYGAVPDQVGPASAAKARAIGGLNDVIAEGLTAYGKELIRTQQQDAASRVAEGLSQAELDLKAKKYVTADEVRQAFGGNVPDHLKERLQVQDPATGELVDNAQIPMWAVGDSLFEQKARRIVDSAAGTIGGSGWQNDFKARIQGHVQGRRNELATYHLHALDQYLQQTQLQTIERLTTAGDFGAARTALSGSQALPPEVRQKAEQHIAVLEVEKPIFDAIRTKDVEGMKQQLAGLGEVTILGAHRKEELGKALDHNIKTIDLADRSRKTVDELLVKAGGDPATALELAKGIQDTLLFDAVDARLKRQVSEQHAMQVAHDTPLEATLETTMYRFGSLDRTSPEYSSLSGPGQARVEAKFLATQRAARAQGSEERRLQNETDKFLEAHFSAMPTRGEAGQDQLSIDIDHSDTFSNGSRTLRESLKAKQKKLLGEAAKGLLVKREKFKAQMTDLGRELGYTKDRLQNFAATMDGQYDAWVGEHDGQMPKQTDINAMAAEAIVQGDSATSGLGHAFSANQFAWQARRSGKEFHAFPVTEQPDQVKAALGRLSGITAAPPPTTGAPAAGKVTRTDPATGETRTWNGSAWVKE